MNPLLIMLLTPIVTEVIKRLFGKIPPQFLPWLSALVGIFGTVVNTTASGDPITGATLSTGAMAGLGAAGIYSAGGKHVLGGVAPKITTAADLEKPPQ